MDRENGAKKSEEKYLNPRARDSTPLRDRCVSLLFLYFATWSTYAGVCTATHAGHKRAEIVTIPTERGARVRIILSVMKMRRVRAIFEEKGRCNLKNSNRSRPRGSYLSKFSSEENTRSKLQMIKRVNFVGSTYTARSESTNEERIPPWAGSHRAT